MAPSLDPFPELCLIAIFIHLPLSDLLAVVGLVCSRWRGLLPTVLARRHTLQIVQADLLVNEFEPAYLYGSELIYKIRQDDGSTWLVDNRSVEPNVAPPQILTELFANFLMDSLPNITNLTVIQSEVDGNLLPEVLTQITRMLGHWQNGLVSLTLSVRSVRIFVRPRERLIRNLFESINRLGSLRHLKIELDFPFGNYEPRLKIFSRLNSLAFKSQYGQQNLVIRSINQYPNPDVITQISTDAFFDLSHCLRFSHKLAAKFYSVGHFPIIVDRNKQVVLQNVETFCVRFTSIRHLFLVLTANSLQTIFPSLAQLQHLVHLELELISGIFNPDLQTPIRSVRLLTISLATKSHQHLESLRLSELFPNVQILQMTHTSFLCLVCGYDGGWNAIKNRPEVLPKIHECQRLARQALTRFPKLHTIRLEQCPGTRDGTLTRWDIINSLEQL